MQELGTQLGRYVSGLIDIDELRDEFLRYISRHPNERDAVQRWLDEAVRVTNAAAPHASLVLPVQEARFSSTLPSVSLTAEVESDAHENPLDDAGTFLNRPPMTPPAVAVDRSDEGFFSGMLKKTSSSVSSSIGKASNSLVGAVRAVGGAVKKAF